MLRGAERQQNQHQPKPERHSEQKEHVTRIPDGVFAAYVEMLAGTLESRVGWLGKFFHIVE
jgi:hypothetical protein